MTIAAPLFAQSNFDFGGTDAQRHMVVFAPTGVDCHVKFELAGFTFDENGDYDESLIPIELKRILTRRNKALVINPKHHGLHTRQTSNWE